VQIAVEGPPGDDAIGLWEGDLVEHRRQHRHQHDRPGRYARAAEGGVVLAVTLEQGAVWPEAQGIPGVVAHGIDVARQRCISGAGERVGVAQELVDHMGHRLRRGVERSDDEAVDVAADGVVVEPRLARPHGHEPGEDVVRNRPPRLHLGPASCDERLHVRLLLGDGDGGGLAGARPLVDEHHVEEGPHPAHRRGLVRAWCAEVLGHDSGGDDPGVTADHVDLTGPPGRIPGLTSASLRFARDSVPGLTSASLRFARDSVQQLGGVVGHEGPDAGDVGVARCPAKGAVLPIEVLPSVHPEDEGAAPARHSLPVDLGKGEVLVAA